MTICSVIQTSHATPQRAVFLLDSSPIQIEPGLSAAWTQYTSGAALPLIFPDRWHRRLAELVRRRDMPVADQPWNFTIDWSHPTPQADGWHLQLSEPVRNKQAVSWQQFYTTDWKWSAAAGTFSYSFALSEIGDFGRFALTNLFTAAGAQVGIVEIPTPSAIVAISQIIEEEMGS